MSEDSIENNSGSSPVLGFVSAARNIGRQVSLRADPKYRYLWDVQNGFSVRAESIEEIRLSDVLLPYHPKMLDKGTLSEPRRIIDLADVEARTSIVLLNEDGDDRVVSEIGSTRLDFGTSDIVFCRLRPYLGKILINDPEQQWIGTSEWIPLKVNRQRVLPVFLKWLLLSPPFLATFDKLKAGKQHPRTNEIDLRSLYIPIPPISSQEGVQADLIKLDRLLTEKRRALRTRSQVIDIALSSALNYRIDDFGVPEGPSLYCRSARQVGSSLELRAGVRFLRPEFDAMEEELHSLHCVRMRDVIDPIRSRLGATITPESYEEEGDAVYISPDVIKGYEIDIASATTVSSKFFDENRKTSGLRKGDLIISRSGIGIGKVALWEAEIPAIFSDFTMRIRFNELIEPFFGYCVGCSSLFQSQINKHKRGAAVPNFFPIQMREFLFPCPPKPKQLGISESIVAALGSMEAQRTELKKIRDDIDRVIMRTLLH